MSKRFVGLALVVAYAVLAAITVWSEPRDADTPPIMAFMMMVLGFVFLAIYLFVRFDSARAERRANKAAASAVPNEA